jgi:hypothetical protein
MTVSEQSAEENIWNRKEETEGWREFHNEKVII